jgi:hypothetical protein
MGNQLSRVFSSSLLLACAINLSQAAPGDTGKMLDKTFQTSKGALKYLLFVPKDYVATKRYPLVVSLRGAGNTYTGATNDNDQAHPWIEDSIQARVPHFIMVPETNEGSWGGPIGGGLSNGILSGPATAVIEGIEDLKKQYSLDTNRFIITGFSIGGTGTYHLIEIKHDYWAAAVPASAGPDTTKLGTISKTPIWHHQGSTDGTAGKRMALGLENRGFKVVRVVVDFTINNSAVQTAKPEEIAFKNAKPPVTLDSLRRAIAGGANFIYTELTGGNHEAGWIGAAHDPLVPTWAFSKVRGGSSVSLAPKAAGSWAKRNGAVLSFGGLNEIEGVVYSLTGQSLVRPGVAVGPRPAQQALILRGEPAR